MVVPWITSAGLLGQVALRVLPAAVFILLAIWMMVGHVSERVFQAEIDAKLQQRAESQAVLAKTKLEHLVTTVRDLAGNDLIINGLVDPGGEANYLKPFLRSVAIEGFSDFPVVLTDYRGRPIAGRQVSAWNQDDLTRWNTKISSEKSLLAQKESDLIVGVPVYIGRLVEGMLVIRMSSEQVHQIIDPIGESGWVAVMPASEQAPDGVRSSEEEGAVALAELALPASDGLKLLSAYHETELSHRTPSFQWFMLAAFVLDLLALIMGILAAVALVIRPLNKFVAHLQRSRQEGSLELFEARDGPLEIRVLAGAFNQFLTSEQHLLQERSEQARRLTEALEREKEVNGLQRQFVSMVCHEFRTPLAIIDGNAYRLLRRHRTMPTHRLEDALAKIRTSVGRLTDLMESVLSAARLEAGTIKFEPQPCDPARMIQEVVANHQEVNPTHRLVADLERLPAEFVMDVKLMRQVISNLLSNAIKYSAEGTTVWIDASSTEEGGLVVAVKDEGVGIPEDELERLFERFFRASTSTGIAGTGIGLHMVKALVELHDGAVDVASDIGKGTTFSVHLPRPACALAKSSFGNARAA